MVVDGKNVLSLLDVVEIAGIDPGRSGESAVPEKNFPTLREPTGLVTWFLEDGSSFLRSDGGELGLLMEKRAVDAPGGDGEEDNVAVEARCSSLASAISNEEARDEDVVPGPYCFRDGGDATVLSWLVCCGPVLFLFLFFPSVKSGFLL